MWGRVQSVANAISGRVPGKFGWNDTATRIAMDAGFNDATGARVVRRRLVQGAERGRLTWTRLRKFSA